MHLFQLPVTEVQILADSFWEGQDLLPKEAGTTLEGSESAQCQDRVYLAFRVCPVHLFNCLMLSCRRNSVFVGCEEMLDSLFQAHVLLFGVLVRVCREQMFIPLGLLWVISWLTAWDDAEN